MCSLDFHSTFKNIICCSLKHPGLWPYADDKRMSNDLVHAVLWQCMFAFSSCLLQLLQSVRHTRPAESKDEKPF